MKLISWNVNGIRAVLNKGFMDFIKSEEPDILCIQETKASKEQVDINLPEYNFYWNSADKKGYSGTLIMSKVKPLFVQNDMGIIEHDNEGRVITAEYEDFYLVNVYTPNSKRALERLEYRKKWDEDFLLFLKTLEEKKPVIVCGDLNVAHQEIDIKNPKSNMTTATKPGNAGFTDTERRDFSNILESGFVDTFRHLYPEKVEYSWWSYMFSARQKNIGWRIDYFLVSDSIIDKIKDAQILNEVMGSDHCPVMIIYNE